MACTLVCRAFPSSSRRILQGRPRATAGLSWLSLSAPSASFPRGRARTSAEDLTHRSPNPPHPFPGRHSPPARVVGDVTADGEEGAVTADHVLVVAPLPQRTGRIGRDFPVPARARRFEPGNELPKVRAHRGPPLKVGAHRGPPIKVGAHCVRPGPRIQTVGPMSRAATQPHNPVEMVGHDHEGIDPRIPTNLICPYPFILHNLTYGRKKDPTSLHPAKYRSSIAHTDCYEVDAGGVVVVLEADGVSLRKTEEIEGGTGEAGHAVTGHPAAREPSSRARDMDRGHASTLSDRNTATGARSAPLTTPTLHLWRTRRAPTP